jgi:glycerol-3-phosphate dehydrogenase (NAD(P)+)
MKIAMLGAGGWGTTLAILLQENGNDVTLWEFNAEYSRTLNQFRENFYYLPDIKIPSQVKITNNLTEAVSRKDIIVISTPTQFIRNSFAEIQNFNFGNSIILNVSKGIENKTNLTVSGILLDIFKQIEKKNIACLSGPSHAEEVARKIPTAVVCASENIENCKIVQKVFSNKNFRVYRSDDLTGTELGGALKNVIAITTGIADGIGFGDNTRAALITRGIQEIMRIGKKMNAREETFYGLSGIGDLIVTCTSKHSRNRFVGEEIGKGRSLKEILKDLKKVAEGVATAKSVHFLSEKLNVEVPIMEQVYKILYKGKNPLKATEELMTRKLKEEY